MEGDFPGVLRRCRDIHRTEDSPYVVFFLYKSSGNFMGMGSIIDKKTVLSSWQVVSMTYDHPENLKILAGSRSPWWAKDSQVRNVKSVAVNDYELAAITVDEDWRFNKNIGPVKLMKHLRADIEPTYGKDFGTYGLFPGENHAHGEKANKNALYYFTLQTFSGEDCGSEYPEMIAPFNSSLHLCFYPNGSYCEGAEGAPVVGKQRDSRWNGDPELVGVVLRSGCIGHPRQVLALKLTDFDHWLRIRSVLGFRTREKVAEEEKPKETLRRSEDPDISFFQQYF